jgi:hypothetical protein
MHMLTAEIVTSCADADSGPWAPERQLATFGAAARRAGRPASRPQTGPVELAGAPRVTGGGAGVRGQGEQAGAAGQPGQAGPCVHSEQAGASTNSEGAQLLSLFEDAAAGLKLGEREVIELRLRQGFAAAEVASVLGVSRGRAQLLLLRAADHLEACLGALLVGRAGRGECEELTCLLAGWDGRLTAALRKRVSRHIEHCPTCKARRAVELRPARLLDLPPGAALAAGAAESFRLALGAPAALRARTMALAAGRGDGAAAHRSAVLTRAGYYGERGFPQPSYAASVGLARPYSIAGARARLRSARPRWVAVAAVAAFVVAVAAVAAIALAAGPGLVTADTRQAHDRPFINHRQLRSWIEQNRLR